MHIDVSAHIAAPLSVVWAAAEDFSSHAEWMSDAHGIEFGTEQRSGAGTVLIVETRVGPLRTADRFRITSMIEPERIIGVHEGAVTGDAVWSFAEDDTGTTFTWTEDLQFPWWFGGRLGELVARPIFVRMWTKNLGRLKDHLETT